MICVVAVRRLGRKRRAKALLPGDAPGVVGQMARKLVLERVPGAAASVR